MAIYTHQFDNGLALLAEEMPWLESAAFALLLPGGCIYDPPNRLGLANLTCELAQRGSGSRDSRQFLEDLELLGVDSSSSVATSHVSFGGAMPAENLEAALTIYADLVRRPHLPEDQLDDARLTCQQEVRAVEDDLAHKVMQRLRERQYPAPFGRASYGTEAGLEAASVADVRDLHGRTYNPRSAILSVAGKIDWPRLRDFIAKLFGDWQARPAQEIKPTDAVRGVEHLSQESAQTHIGLSYDGLPYSHADYYEARAAIGVLSDGMSSRLFTEVREKRGLSYSVYAYCHSLRDRGAVFSYAGTSTERAQETLDVLVAEIRRLADGVAPDELDRLKSRLKSSLILQQESSSQRSGAMASEWYHLGRLQTLEELGGIVDNLSVEKINKYLAANPPGRFTIVTLGGKPLTMPIE